jgi:hypothetical protein
MYMINKNNKSNNKIYFPYLNKNGNNKISQEFICVYIKINKNKLTNNQRKPIIKEIIMNVHNNFMRPYMDAFLYI